MSTISTAYQLEPYGLCLCSSLAVIFTVGVFRQLSGSVVKTIIWRCSLAQRAVFGSLPIVGWDIWLSTLQTSCPQNSTLIVCVRLLWLSRFLWCVVTVSYSSFWSPTGCIVWLIFTAVYSHKHHNFFHVNWLHQTAGLWSLNGTPLCNIWGDWSFCGNICV